MKRLFQYSHYLLICAGFLLAVSIYRWTFDEASTVRIIPLVDKTKHREETISRHPPCSCTRPLLSSSTGIMNSTFSSLCSNYSTLRGFHQRVISISMYHSRANARFSMNTSMNYLDKLIHDMKSKYPEWILRIYHDETIPSDLICSTECTHHFVDFCNTSSLGQLGRLRSYIPGKIWRFLPIGDELVDIIASRDLDSPLTQREIDAVNDWLSSNKAWHVMRDHPLHVAPMLGGMWAFRPAFNRTFAENLRKKMLDRSSISRYGGVGDQTFLTDNIWPYIQRDLIVHDSFLCQTSYGRNSRAWPTRRPSLSNETHCFVGCVRPCCISMKYPFQHCPVACRPRNHTDWNFC